MISDPRDDAAIRRFYRNLGARIRAARLAAGLSQDQLAENVGIVRSSVANLEAGRQRVPAHTLALLLDTLHASPADVLTGPDMWERFDEFTNLADPLAATDTDTRDFVTAALDSLNADPGSAA